MHYRMREYFDRRGRNGSYTPFVVGEMLLVKLMRMLAHACKLTFNAVWDFFHQGRITSLPKLRW